MSHNHSQFLPLPAQANPQPEPDEGYRLQRQGENGYIVISGFVQSTFVVTNESVVVVDAPPAIGDKLSAAIRSVTDKPVSHFIYTHSHVDHVGASNQFPGVTRIAHEEAKRIIALHNDPARPVPTQTFDGERTTLSIGGETIELIYPGPNHEVGNILVWFPNQKLAHMSDLVMPGWAPYRGWGNADYPPGILAAHDAILALDFETYVGGHVYRTGNRADVEQSREFFIDLWTTTQGQMSKVSYMDAMAEAEPANAWAAQTVYFERVAAAVTSELIDRWGDRIAAVDTFTAATVESVIVSISTDAPISFPR